MDGQGLGEAASRVLLASVSNVMYPVDLDLIHHLFSRYGEIEKIVSFVKTPAMYQALVQFARAPDAQQALTNLNNRNIYDGCNTLQLQESRLSELVVKTNCSKSWDYTQSAAGPGAAAAAALVEQQQQGSHHHHLHEQHPHAAAGRGMPPPFGGPPLYPHRAGLHVSHPFVDRLPPELRELDFEFTNPAQTPVIIVYNIPPSVTLPMLFNLFTLYGTVLRIKILRDRPDTALIQYSEPFFATIAQYLMQGAVVGGQTLQVALSKNREVRLPPSTPGVPGTEDGAAAREEERRTVAFNLKDQRYGADEVEKYVKSASRPTKTVFVANLDEDITAEVVAALFKQFGNVGKFSFKKPKNEASKTRMCVMEMDSEEQALNAVMHLHNYELRGRCIKVAFSRSIL